MQTRRPSRYKFLTFVVAVIAGIVIADLVYPESGSATNLLIGAVVAAIVAVAMAWFGVRREK